MADFPSIDAAALADFSGREAGLYPQQYTAQAVKQTILWFKVATCLEEFPDSGTDREVAEMALLQMANMLIDLQEHAAALNTPFQSESLGSYSYSKIAGAISSGMPTGVHWFDTAVDRLSQCSLVGLADGGSAGGGIEIFEHQGRLVGGSRAGNARFVGPADETLRIYRDPSIRG